MASSRRHGGGAGNYSSLGLLTAFFWFCWLMMTTVVPGSDSANWTQSTAAALGLGLMCLAGEVLGVRLLNRLGPPSAPSS